MRSARKVSAVGALAFVCVGLVSGYGGADALYVQAQITQTAAPGVLSPATAGSPPRAWRAGWLQRVAPAQEGNPLRLFVPYPWLIAGDDSVLPAPFPNSGPASWAAQAAGSSDGGGSGPPVAAPQLPVVPLANYPPTVPLSLVSGQPDSPPYAGDAPGNALDTLTAAAIPGVWYTGPQGSRAALSSSMGTLHTRAARLSLLSLERVLDSKTYLAHAPVVAPQPQASLLPDAIITGQRPTVASGMRMVGVHPADTQYAQAAATPQPTPTTSQASYTQSATASPVAGDTGNWTAATMPGGNARPFYVTGYTATGNPTFTGTIPHWGTVAVDPHIIPLGSTVYIQGLGVFTAEDTGGAIIGYRVDVFVPTAPEAYAITGLRLVSFVPPAH